ncbi:MAG: DUF1576 domain-containing protein [Treponema sp.]|nr:DUF1576 domain-containing protein [Treponema sp.]MCL2237158.1 DUF1576 domain-containing protein [Treponema sp.]
MPGRSRYAVPVDYFIMLGICFLFIVLAFCMNTPSMVMEGFLKIQTSRSVLITDYIELAGIGAAFVNSAILTIFNLFLLIVNKRDPNGKIIASLFLTIGFSLFGKNMLNTLPIIAGVWLYGKVAGKKFSEMVIFAMVSATIAPIVSEIAFLNEEFNIIKFITAYFIGIFVGFIFPVVADYVKVMHNHYCLYNGGIAGGFIATMFAGFLRSINIEIIPENLWDTEHTFQLAIVAYSIALALIVYGFITDKPLNAVAKFFNLLKEKDPEDCDYLTKYHNTCYINIGIMCIVSTTVMLVLGYPINGPILGGIFTVSGFAACGKHLRNATPIIIGSILAVYLNHLDSMSSVNTLAILFSTGLAPIAGRYGWHWGIITGFLHVSIAVFIGDVNGGLNLYNNGFAGSFIAVLILPIIIIFRRINSKIKKKDKS